MTGAIRGFLTREWNRRHPPHKGFGEGGAAAKFIAVLADTAFWSRLLQKEFTDNAPALNIRKSIKGGKKQFDANQPLRYNSAPVR